MSPPPEKQNGRAEDLGAVAPPTGSAVESAAEWVPLDRVKLWERNPRKNDPAVPKVARSIRRYGFVAPLVVWRSRDRLVAGHTRYRAMELLLREDPAFIPRGAPGAGLVPVRFHEFLSEAEANAYAIADNRLAEEAEWDDAALADELAILRNEGFDLAETGFDDAEIKILLNEYENPLGDGDGGEREIVDDGKEKIAVRVLLVQAERARVVITEALAVAGIQAEID